MGTAARAIRAFIHLGVPLLLVLLSVALLAAAALASAFDLLPKSQQLALFGAGGLSWLVGIGWGVLVNDRPGAWRAA